jgi:hypothetical protein
MALKVSGQHPIQSVVQIVVLRLRINDEMVPRWYVYLQTHAVRIATSLVFLGLFDGHAAACDMGMKLLELICLIPDQVIEVLGLLNVPKGYFERQFHTFILFSVYRLSRRKR